MAAFFTVTIFVVWLTVFGILKPQHVTKESGSLRAHMYLFIHYMQGFSLSSFLCVCLYYVAESSGAGAIGSRRNSCSATSSCSGMSYFCHSLLFLSLLFVHVAVGKMRVPHIIFDKHLVLLDWPGSLTLI